MRPSAPTCTVITGAGVCTPLGLTALASLAAFRAGMIRASETDLVGRDGEPIRASYLSRLPADSTHQERVLGLSTWALDDLLRQARPAPATRVQAFIALPGSGHGYEAQALAQAVTRLITSRLPALSRPRFFFQGRSALFFALQSAVDALAAGECEEALVGGADSLCSPGKLKKLDAERRLLVSGGDGLIPGEGSAFLWLGRPGRTAAAPGSPLAAVLCVATAKEDRHFLQEQPCTADALSSLFATLAHHPSMQGHAASLLYTCETGERFWAQEFMAAYLRNTPLMPEPFAKTMAGESFGDLGASAGGVMLGIGAQLLHRRHRGSPSRLLLCGSSDDGHVGACVMQAA